MKEQKEIPWLHTYEEIWQQLLNSKRTPHAVLITGTRGIGKRSTVSEPHSILFTTIRHTNGMDWERIAGLVGSEQFQ